MTYLLDTNVCVTLLRNRDPGLRSRVLGQPYGIVTVCAIVAAELYEGAYRSNRLQQNLTQVQQFITQFPCLPFDSPAAEIAGQIAANLGLKGQSIGAYDTQIAAIAIANNLTLVTHNVREFGRVTGLVYEDWQTNP